VDGERKPSLLVIIPSRLAKSQGGFYFLERAVKSIRGQQVTGQVDIDISVGVDPDAAVPELETLKGLYWEVSTAPSQAGALNAAARRFDHDYIAVLEDDDVWTPPFLGLALAALKQADFASSTQLEVTDRGEVVYINDFPTPSGWVMHRRVWEGVGGFNEAFRFHLDNEWLGRLSMTDHKRLHLVEATAPVALDRIRYGRPRLGLVLSNGGPNVRLGRHKFLAPLVRRTVHVGSGMAQIVADPEKRALSQSENDQLAERFGRLPW
jgi:hypothetical protein